MATVSISTLLARMKRGAVVPPSPIPFHKGWAERQPEREFVKGLALSRVHYSNRRDYVGLEVHTSCPYDAKVNYSFSVFEREGVRTLVFIKSRKGYGHILRRIKLGDRDKVSSYSSIIFNFLNGEPLCATLKKLQSAFLPVS